MTKAGKIRGSELYRTKDDAKRVLVKLLAKKDPRTSEQLERLTNMTKVYILRLLRELRDEGRVKLVARNVGWVRA